MEESQDEAWAAVVPSKTESIASKKGIMEEEVILTPRSQRLSLHWGQGVYNSRSRIGGR